MFLAADEFPFIYRIKSILKPLKLYELYFLEDHIENFIKTSGHNQGLSSHTVTSTYILSDFKRNAIIRLEEYFTLNAMG